MAAKLLLLTHPMKLLPEIDPKASTFSCHPRLSSCPRGRAGKQTLNFLHKTHPITPQNHFLLSNSYPSAESASNFTCTQLLCTLSCKSSSRSVISSCHGMTRSASAVNASGTDQGLYVHSPHDLVSDGSKPKLPLPPLLIALAIPLIAGAIDSFFNNPNKPWYKNLKKPAWTPPGWIFGLVWSVLYGAMGFASWLVWTQGGWEKQAYPLIAYSLQLVLNLSWVAVFFGAENLGLAMFDMILLIIAIFACIGAFQPVNPVAADLMKVYLVWVLFAAFLNYTLWVRNKHPRAA